MTTCIKAIRKEDFTSFFYYVIYENIYTTFKVSKRTLIIRA